MPNRKFPPVELFSRLWQLGSSSEDVSFKLSCSGYRNMTPKVVYRWARTLIEIGVHLKRMPRPIPVTEDSVVRSRRRFDRG